MLKRTLYDLGISENQYKFQPHVLNIDVCILKGDVWTEVWPKKKKQRKTSEKPNLTARKMAIMKVIDHGTNFTMIHLTELNKCVNIFFCLSEERLKTVVIPNGTFLLPY